MRSNVTCMMRFCANMRSRCVCVLDYIMHSDDKQDLDNLAHLVHNPHRDLMCLVRHMSPRRDYNHWQMNSRDRSRRT
jgi:hypothetical protein